MKPRHWLRAHPLVYYWLPLAVWMGLIFYLSAQPELPGPDNDRLGELLRSGGHAFVFGVLAILWARVLGQRRWALVLAFALTMVYALSDEFHQSFVPGRHPDLWDVACDAAGAVMALLLWTWVQRRRLRARQGG